jgi:hypothetical protein
MKLTPRFLWSKRSIAAALLCSAALWATWSAPHAAQSADTAAGARPSAGAGGLFELRVYNIKPDLWKGTLQFMENADRFQLAVGMKILGHFIDQVENKYIWMRSYPDEATRLRLFKDVYESEIWKSGELRKGIQSGIDGTAVYLTKPTRYSHLQYPPPPPTAKPGGSSPLVVEVTMSEIKPGMMDSWVKYMGEKVAPWEESVGVRVFAQLVPYTKVTGSANGGALAPVDNLHVAIRIFTDEATRARQAKALDEKRSSARLGSAADAGLEQARVYRAHPTSYSELQ